MVVAALCYVAILIALLYVVANITAQATLRTSDSVEIFDGDTINVVSDNVIDETDNAEASSDGNVDADNGTENTEADATGDTTSSETVVGVDANGETITGTVISQEAVDDEGNPIEDTPESGLGDAELIIIEE